MNLFNIIIVAFKLFCRFKIILYNILNPKEQIMKRYFDLKVLTSLLAITILFAYCKKGIAFNVMSKHVDWERNDLFH